MFKKNKMGLTPFGCRYDEAGYDVLVESAV
jgi:hypothetical protein